MSKLEKEVDSANNKFLYRAFSKRNFNIDVGITKPHDGSAITNNANTLVLGSLEEMFSLYMAIENFRRITNESEEEFNMFRMSADFSSQINQVDAFLKVKNVFRWYHRDSEIDAEGGKKDAVAYAIAKGETVFFYVSDLKGDYQMRMMIAVLQPDLPKNVKIAIEYLNKRKFEVCALEPLMLTYSELQALHWALYDFCLQKLGRTYQKNITRLTEENVQYDVNFTGGGDKRF